MLISISDLEAPKITRHPVSACQPPLEAEALAALRESVRRDGIQQPILVKADRKEAEVVDGWHRMQALIDVKPPLVAQSTRCLRVLSSEECEPERMAQLVDGLLRGRRHLSKRELGQQQVAIYRAVGIDWETPGGNRRDQNPAPTDTYEPSAQNERLPFDQDNKPRITPGHIAGKTGISPATARRAIADVQAQERQETDPTPDIAAEKRKARAAAKAGAQLSEKDELRGQARFWKETAESAGADRDAMRLQIAGDPVTRQDEIDKLRAKLKIERERATQAEAKVRYWKKYATRMETALERIREQQTGGDQ